MSVTTQYYLKGSETALSQARKIAENFDWLEFYTPETPEYHYTVINIQERNGFTVIEFIASYCPVDILDRLRAINGLTEPIYAVFGDEFKECITNDRAGLIVTPERFPSPRVIVLDEPLDDGSYVLPEIDLRPEELL